MNNQIIKNEKNIDVYYLHVYFRILWFNFTLLKNTILII